MWKLVEEFDKKKWNEFVKKNGPLSGRFLQSWEWGEFQKAVGEKVERWSTEDDRREQKRTDGVASLIIRQLPGFGEYAYCPRGPIVKDDFSTALKALSEIVDPIIFFRFELLTSFHRGEEMSTHKTNKTFHKTIDLQPSHTWITPLELSEEKLFESLHKKTRYNIGLAKRHGVEVCLNEIDFDSVWPIFVETGSRGEFRLHPKDYYQKMLRTINTEYCRSFLAVAVFEQKPIAVNLMLDFGGVRTYLHGASSHKYRSLMAPHLLHFELIKDAKQKGFSFYDWWGIAPSDQPNHPWAGITRFKKSFPGREVVYAGTYDFVRKPFWYKVYRLARKLRRMSS
ncbi:peptidoglycan bridge formation glycyltransferase FemA/FemB family protein [Candidatus Uhrbacteria bacterium]|nr:peptidoglycan bridge formation glycyltransferase FemA/FemB family protein [Candidatus Uhrbacteria bacterium]